MAGVLCESGRYTTYRRDFSQHREAAVAEVQNFVSPGAHVGGSVVQSRDVGSVAFGHAPGPGQAPVVQVDGTTFGTDEAQGIRMLMETRGTLLPVLDEGEAAAVIMLLQTVPRQPATAVFGDVVNELVARLRARANLAQEPRD
jgi:hypothetical protein